MYQSTSSLPIINNWTNYGIKNHIKINAQNIICDSFCPHNRCVKVLSYDGTRKS